MARRIAIVTGSSGLIGSEMVSYLDERGWRVQGVDNNMRRDFFGEDGDTSWNLERLLRETKSVTAPRSLFTAPGNRPTIWRRQGHSTTSTPTQSER